MLFRQYIFLLNQQKTITSCFPKYKANNGDQFHSLPLPELWEYEIGSLENSQRKDSHNNFKSNYAIFISM